MQKHNKYQNDEETEQLTIDTYMTVFWPEMRSDNLYINDLLLLCNRILNIDLTKVDKNDYKNINDEYTSYYKNIHRLSECVNILLSNRLYQKYTLYKDSFIDKVTALHTQMTSYHIMVDQNKFLDFMYKNTVEGRIVAQNNAAVADLEIIEATRDRLSLLHKTLYPILNTN